MSNTPSASTTTTVRAAEQVDDCAELAPIASVAAHDLDAVYQAFKAHNAAEDRAARERCAAEARAARGTSSFASSFFAGTARAAFWTATTAAAARVVCDFGVDAYNDRVVADRNARAALVASAARFARETSAARVAFEASIALEASATRARHALLSQSASAAGATCESAAGGVTRDAVAESAAGVTGRK